MADPSPKNTEPPAPDGKPKPGLRNERPAASSDTDVEPLDEDILDKVMRETPL